MPGSSEKADRTMDSFAERVVRNEAALNALRDLVRETRAADRQLVEQRSDSIADALKLQAKEYERRLKNLNGEAARIASIQSQSVTRELFDAELRSVRAEIVNLKDVIRSEVEAARQINAQRISVLESEVEALKLGASQQTGKSTGYQQVYGWALGAVGALSAAVAIIIGTR